jgi:hypothetical protein
MKTIFFTIITSVLRSVAAARAIVLAALLIGASTTNLCAATFSDDNWIGMNGYPGTGAVGRLWDVRLLRAEIIREQSSTV